MKLHRTSGKPDWESIPLSEQSGIQKVAASTQGWVTPGNTFTVIGFIGIAISIYLVSQHHYGIGLLVLLAARACDLLDGMVAEATGTKSPLGETFDAAADKIGTAALLIGFVATAVLPGYIAVALAVPQLVIATFVLIGLYKNSRLHPSRVGKLSMFALGFTLFGFLAAKTSVLAGNTLFTIFVYLIAATALVLSIAALLDYTRQLHKN